MTITMTDQEKRLLVALAWMTEQFLSTKEGCLDHLFMSAGERAISLLAEYDLVVEKGRDSHWTEAGHLFLLKN